MSHWGKIEQLCESLKFIVGARMNELIKTGSKNFSNMRTLPENTSE